MSKKNEMLAYVRRIAWQDRMTWKMNHEGFPEEEFANHPRETWEETESVVDVAVRRMAMRCDTIGHMPDPIEIAEMFKEYIENFCVKRIPESIPHVEQVAPLGWKIQWRPVP